MHCRQICKWYSLQKRPTTRYHRLEELVASIDCKHLRQRRREKLFASRLSVSLMALSFQSVFNKAHAHRKRTHLTTALIALWGSLSATMHHHIYLIGQQLPSSTSDMLIFFSFAMSNSMYVITLSFRCYA